MTKGPWKKGVLATAESDAAVGSLWNHSFAHHSFSCSFIIVLAQPLLFNGIGYHTHLADGKLRPRERNGFAEVLAKS